MCLGFLFLCWFWLRLSTGLRNVGLCGEISSCSLPRMDCILPRVSVLSPWQSWVRDSSGLSFQRTVLAVGAFSHASYCSIPCSLSFPLFELHGPVTSHQVSRVAVWCLHGPAPHSGVTSTPSASRVHGWREWEPPVCGQHCAGRSHTPLSPSPVPFSNFNVSPRMPSMLPACLSI